MPKRSSTKIVIAHDRIVLGNKGVGIALKAQRLQLDPGQAGTAQNKANDPGNESG